MNRIKMTKTGNLQRKLTRARTQLLLTQPFFGTLCLRLKVMAGRVPTMATDGRRILYDPVFVDSLQSAELEAVLAHEVMHCALGHHCRRGQRDPRLWNEAADLAINPLLVANGFSLPARALLDPAFDNLSAEEIYTRLAQRNNGSSSTEQTQPPQRQGSGGAAAGPEQEDGGTSLNPGGLCSKTGRELRSNYVSTSGRTIFPYAQTGN